MKFKMSLVGNTLYGSLEEPKVLPTLKKKKTLELGEQASLTEFTF